MELIPKCFTVTGQIQEEEEKETQETRQKKEKEGSISVRLGARLTTVALRFSHPPDKFTSSVISAFDSSKLPPSSFGHHA